MRNQTVRLAYLVSRYPAISHTFILREVLHLREQGFEIHVASVNPPDRDAAALTEVERAEALSTYCLKSANPLRILRDNLTMFWRRPLRCSRAFLYALRFSGWDLRRIAYSLFYYAEAAMVGRWMEHNGLSHLHVHFATPAATVGLILTRLYPATLSITIHGPDEFYDVSVYSLRRKIEEASFLCAIGSFARSQLMKLSAPEHWDKIEVTPLGVDGAEFTPRKAPAERSRFEVVCVGRLVPAKGQHVLIAAVEQLAREGRDVFLRLVGDGPDRQSLEQLVQRNQLGPNVRFEGAVNQEHIRRFYETADVFALASFAEGIPVVLMEAMAMEVPCVATRITGIPELVRDGIDGLLVSPSDQEELARALARLMDDRELRLRLGRQGRARVLSHYDLRRNVQRLGEVFIRRLTGSSVSLKKSDVAA